MNDTTESQEFADEGEQEWPHLQHAAQQHRILSDSDDRSLRRSEVAVEAGRSGAVVESRYALVMETAMSLLEQAMRLPPDEREDLAAKLLDSLEPPPGISIEDSEELEKRAPEVRSGAPGVPWEELKRDCLK